MTFEYAIAVVHHGDLELTRACLRSLADLAPAPKRVIVIWNDDDGPVPTDALPGRPPAPVELLTPGSNVGFPAAANLALATARGLRCDAVWLLNNDVTAEPTCIPLLVDALAADPSVAIAGPRIIGAREGTIWHDGGTIDLVRGRTHGTRHGRPADAPPQDPFETEFVSGCAPLIRVAAWDSVGGLDEAYFLCYEDTDFCLRLAARGWRLLQVPAARVQHIGSASLEADPAGARYYRLRGRLRFLALHGNQGPRSRARRLRLVGACLWRAFALLVRGRAAEAGATWAALWDALRGRGGPRSLGPVRARRNDRKGA